MIKKNEVLTPKEALQTYADWLLNQRTDDHFFKCHARGTQRYEWYMIFYCVRTLLCAGRLLGERRYIEAVLPYFDNYVSEQLPNGGFTSNFRKNPTSRLAKAELHEILCSGRVNLADAGSNVTALIQGAFEADENRRKQYLDAARRWLDEWAPIWALPDGGYGNCIWGGHKLNGPYTMAIANTASAYSAFFRATGETEYCEAAERCIRFQCGHWLADGRPINLSIYPTPHRQVINDYGRVFYLLEGLCWTHSITSVPELKLLIETRLREWMFGANGILAQWNGSWFDFNSWDEAEPASPENNLPQSRTGLRHFWEYSKSNGIPAFFSYYLHHIEDVPALREKMERAIQFLCQPCKAIMTGVMSDPGESYGQFAVQATGFAGLSLAEAIKPDSSFFIN